MRRLRFLLKHLMHVEAIASPLRLLRVWRVCCWLIAASCCFTATADEIDSTFRLTDTHGDGFVVDQNGNIILLFTDFDDLHTFNIFFSEVSSDANEGSGAVDALDVIWLGEAPRDRPTESSSYVLPQAGNALRMRNWQKTGFEGGSLRPDTNDGTADVQFNARFATIENAVENRVGFIYGLGALALDQQAQMKASGNIMGTSYWMAGIQNQIIGPKGGVIWQQRLGKWTLDVQGLLMFGANAGDVSNTTVRGEELIPGALNRPLYARPTRFEQDNSSLSLSPVGELRAESCWRLSKGMSLHVNWSSTAVNNLLVVGDQPDLATTPISEYGVNKEDLLVHHLFCGVEYVR